MCAIIGFKGEYDSSLLRPIFDNSRIRGIHAFGYSFYLDGVLTTKKFLKYTEFVDSIDSDKPNLFIAHFRYSTSGDYMTICNNQPLTKKDFSIAFNGVISQKTMKEMEQEFKIKLPADNDGFILMEKYEDLEFISNPKYSFAMIGLVGGELIAIRNNNRPMWISDIGVNTVICSTKDIFNRSGIQQASEVQPLIILKC